MVDVSRRYDWPWPVSGVTARLIGFYVEAFDSMKSEPANWQRARAISADMDARESAEEHTAHPIALLDVAYMAYLRLTPSANAVGRLHVSRRLNRIALQLFAIRGQSGAFPQLLPPATPDDPFTGKPYLYRVEGRRFVLYSVGPNGIDEGGGRNVGGTRKSDDVEFKFSVYEKP